MRLTTEQIKSAILEPEQDVRDAAVEYFSRSYSPDPTVMPLVIEAVEKYGWEAAFPNYFFLKHLHYTEATIDWLIRKLQDVKQVHTEDETFCVDALIQADPVLLQPHEAEIRKLRALDADDQMAIEQRILLLSQPPEELWHKLEELCKSLDEDDEPSTGDMNRANRFVEALARHPQQFAGRVLAILRDEDQESGSWMGNCAIQIAGEMRLHAAIPQLVEFLQGDGDWSAQESRQALIKLGTDEVVSALARDYSSGDWSYRYSVTNILEDIHVDLAVQTAYELQKDEEDPELCMALVRAALMHFDPIGIELARDFILNNELDPDVLDLRAVLLTVCKMTGERIPEFEDWLADSEFDDDFRLNWFTKDSQNTDFEDVEDFGDELLEDPDDHDEASRHDEPPITIVREDARVGRNAPCPCGSGKKYKVCHGDPRNRANG